jgi:hypothetical protein
MTRLPTLRFPTLRRAFTGYLHEDGLVEAGSPEAALQSFWADASPAERRRFQRELARFLDRTAALDFPDVCDALSRLGSRWQPPSRDVLTRVLTRVAGAAT